MGKREPVRGDPNPVSHGYGVEDGQAGTGGDVGDQMRGDGAFVPVFASSGVGPQGFLDGADKEVDPQRQQNDHADGLQDSPESRVGQVGEEIVAAEKDQGEEDQVAGDGADSAGEGTAPTADHAAADGQHVDRAHRGGRRQSHEKCGREYVDVRDEHHVEPPR